MLECPSCQTALPPGARFCAHCGASLSVVVTATLDLDERGEPTLYRSVASLQRVPGAEETAVILQESVDLLQQSELTNGVALQEEQIPLELLDVQDQEIQEVHLDSADPYARKKYDLGLQCTVMTASMESLLPFVYENHRTENQELFASTLGGNLPLEDPIWGRVAFVLGAYGNYMYRYPLHAKQKRQVWQALLWAVYYERCYRRKYLAQRCQQLLHFFQGCASEPVFLTYAFTDLEELHSYLETSSLKKLEEALRQLLNPPASLLQRVSEQLARVQAQNLLVQVPSSGRSRMPVQRGKAGASREEVADQPRSARQLPPQQMNQARRPVFQPLRESTDQPRVAPALLPPRKDPVYPAQRPEESVPGGWKLLSFFTEAQRQDFFVCLRGARLEKVDQMLQGVRQPLLKALLQELDTADLRDYRAPRRPIRLGRKTTDRFAEARRLLGSQRVSEQQMALHLFEQGARDTTHPDYVLLAREWMLYARALAQGSHRVVNDWESNLQREEASWEEIWNLAVFYQQTGYLVEALRVLSPGISARSAPVAHLRFALVCALNLLLEPGRQSASVQQGGHAFLVTYLEQWPHPLACLAWLRLAQEAHGPLHPRQQSQRLSTFQELIEHPLSLPDPQRDMPESRVTDLEVALIEKASCVEAWFLWIHDYAEHHPRKYQAWTRLAETSERLGRLDSAEHALQHLVEIQYYHDYVRYQEGAPLPRAEYLLRNLEKLFEFYQRHNLNDYAAEAFHSCYPSLRHLWDIHDPASRKLIALTQSYLEIQLLQEEQTVTMRRENVTRELSKTVTQQLEPFSVDKHVGIFVDYENIACFIPHEMNIELVAQALVDYAEQFGIVVCQWVAASPHNFSNLAAVRAGLEAARFNVRFPRRELQFSGSKKNLADFALLECLSEATLKEHPEVYLIVSGDRDYYERICSLLDAGCIVRLLAASDSQHLSLKYRELEQQRIHERQIAGHETSDFFIDDLGEILASQVSVH
jgi:hypothetical protein